MGFIAHSPPNYASAFATYGYPEGPVIVSATLPGQALFVQVNGVFNMVSFYTLSIVTNTNIFLR